MNPFSSENGSFCTFKAFYHGDSWIKRFFDSLTLIFHSLILLVSFIGYVYDIRVVIMSKRNNCKSCVDGKSNLNGTTFTLQKHIFQFNVFRNEIPTGTVCPSMRFAVPSIWNLPKRGPRTAAPTNAAVPPTMWTTPLPAKSWNCKNGKCYYMWFCLLARVLQLYL